MDVCKRNGARSGGVQWIGAALAVALLCVGAGNAVAQQNASGETAAQQQRSRAPLEEVVVSARRVEESLQNVPISVAVFTSDDLELRGITKGEDLMSLAPNVVVSGGGITQSQSTIVIRGMPNVGLYLDGVAQSGDGLLQQSMIELERMEILRGPQGTLFGRNSNGGAIQMITKKPLPEFGARVKAEVGDYNLEVLSAAVDVPFSDKVLSKFTIGQFSQDGQICSLIVPACYGNRDDEVARADFLWTPNDNFDFRVAYDYQRTVSSDRKEALIVDPRHIRLAALNIAARNPAFRNEWLPLSEYSPRTHNPGYPGGEVGEWQTKSDGPQDGIQIAYDALTATLHWNINDKISLESISAAWQKDEDIYRDIRGAEVIEGVEDHYFSKDKVWSQEVHITGTHMDGRLTWLAGMWYQNYDDWDATYRWNVPWAVLPDGPDANCQPDPNPDIVAWVRDPANWGEYATMDIWGGDLATWLPQNIPPSACFGDPTRNVTHDYAIFGEVGYSLTDKLDLTVGGRWSDRDHTTYLFSRVGVPGTAVKPTYPGPIIGDVWAANQTSSKKDPNTSVWFTPKVSLDYKWTDDVMVYISYAEGFTSAEVNYVATIGQYVENDPELVKTVELGIHSDWLDGTLRFNGSMYFTNWENIRTEVAPVDPNNPNGGIFLGPVLVTGGNAKASGLDGEVIWRPNDNWYFTGAVGLLDTKYVELVPGVPVDENQPFAYAPKYSYNVGVQRDWHLGNGGLLTLRGDYRYMDDYVTHQRNDFQVPQKGFGLSSARLVYEEPAQRWSAYLYGTNLADTRYWNSGFAGNGGVFFGSVGPRRQVGAGMTFSFD